VLTIIGPGGYAAEAILLKSHPDEGILNCGGPWQDATEAHRRQCCPDRKWFTHGVALTIQSNRDSSAVTTLSEVRFGAPHVLQRTFLFSFRGTILCL